ncbi:MAG: aldehyde dehydrogenase [Oligoflexia bacterium]|nr:aldehyde dehydrogenase [Oligoflexia bacterium]
MNSNTSNTSNPNNIKECLNKQKHFFNQHITKDFNFRVAQLKKLHSAIKDQSNAIIQALYQDLRRPEHEAYASEIGIVMDEISYTLAHLQTWMHPKKVKTPMLNFYGKSFIYPEPYGVVLIMGPWNYPLQLTLAPLIGAIAAGNCAFIRPSEHAPATANIINNIITQNFDPEYLKVFLGDVDVSKSLLQEKYNYIFFTGSTAVGKIVMRAAAENLTPVTLELGGKSPCIVDSDMDKDSDLDIAVKRIAWGKFINCGQTCVAPDYLLVHKDIKQLLIDKLIKHIKDFYGENPQVSNDYNRIINKQHFQRLINLISSDKIPSDKIIYGNKHSETDLYISPTLIDIDNLPTDLPLMQEEIFGPILPIKSFSKLDEAIGEIKNNSHPLALYYFSNNKQNQEKVLKEIPFGGGCINDTIMHLLSNHLPFGGIGNSGIGSYHGKKSFDTFTHYKSILKKSLWPDLKLKYPPYKKSYMLLLRLFLR